MDAHRGVGTRPSVELSQQLAVAGRLGFDFVEILMRDSGERSRLAANQGRIRDHLEEGCLDCVVHLPFAGVDPGSPHEHVRNGSREELEACLDVAATIGARKAVVHPESGATDPGRRRRLMAGAVRRLDEYAADRDIVLCAETRGAGGYVTIVDFDHVFADTDAQVCIDTGHARIAGYDTEDMAAFAAEHADRISHFHLNDTTGQSDDHLPVGAGTIDFATVFEGLAGWSGTLTIETKTTDPEYLALALDRLDGLL